MSSLDDQRAEPWQKLGSALICILHLHDKGICDLPTGKTRRIWRSNWQNPAKCPRVVVGFWRFNASSRDQAKSSNLKPSNQQHSNATLKAVKMILLWRSSSSKTPVVNSKAAPHKFSSRAFLGTISGSHSRKRLWCFPYLHSIWSLSTSGGIVVFDGSLRNYITRWQQSKHHLARLLRYCWVLRQRRERPESRSRAESRLLSVARLLLSPGTWGLDVELKIWSLVWMIDERFVFSGADIVMCSVAKILMYKGNLAADRLCLWRAAAYHLL